MNMCSLILLCYNQEKYVYDAVLSCLEQEGPAIQIIISDDCSTDNTYSILKELVKSYKGGHEVVLRKTPLNLGLVGNFNSALSVASGVNIVVSGGDDISHRKRAAKSVSVMKNKVNATCVSMGLDLIDSQNISLVGKKRNLYEKLSTLKPAKAYSINDLISNKVKGLSGASRCFQRDVQKYFGPLNENCPTEDSTTLLRCLILGSGYSSAVPGVKYRIHEDNLSSKKGLKKMDINEIFKQYRIDISRARTGGIIDASCEKRLIEWSIVNMEARIVNLYDEALQDSQNDHIVANLSESVRKIIIASRLGQRSVSKEILLSKISSSSFSLEARLALIICLSDEGDFRLAKDHFDKLKDYEGAENYISLAEKVVTPIR